VVELVGVFASQIGKTDCVLNIVGHRIATNPGPMLLIQPTLGMAESWSKDRLAPMLRDTPALRGKVRDARSRDSGNTVLHKQFPGGHITAAGANSPASLAMRPIRDAFFDEVDRYPASAGTEGDPLKLATTRTRAFWNRKIVYISSPGTRGASRIEGVWERSDQRFYYVPCPACGVRQTLKWSQVAWDKDEEGEHRPETARYVCESCGVGWSDLERRGAVRKGEWRATRPFTGCAGFRVNALAAPWDSCNLEHLVVQWLEAQGNPELLKVFVNTVLAEWWDDAQATRVIDETGLLSRREAMESRGNRLVVPAPVALLTAGVDVQDNRLELSVFGWASGEESWRLAHEVLYGDPSAPAVWEDLDRYLLAPWPRAAGGVDFVRGACVDTGGHHTQAAYDFCGPRFRRLTPDGGRAFVFAVKGQTGSGDVWPRAHSKASAKTPLYGIRVDPAKEQIYGRLSVAEPGPGFVHFPAEATVEYMQGLTSEVLVPKVDRKTGFVRRTWALRAGRKRNEPLDCAVYAYAALCGLRPMGYDLETAVAELPHRVAAGDLVQPHGPTGAPQAAPIAPRRAPAASGWLGETRGWLR
jgi:phage terminase large subunit GpA-like protein